MALAFTQLFDIQRPANNDVYSNDVPGVTSGDQILIAIASSGAPTGQADPVVTLGAATAILLARQDNGTARYTYIYYVTALATGTITATVDWVGNQGRMQWSFTKVTGHFISPGATADLLVEQSKGWTTSAATTTFSPFNNFRAHSNSNAVFACFQIDEGTSNAIALAAAQGTVLYNDRVTGEEQRMMAAYRIGEHATSGLITITPTCSNNANWICCAIEIRAADAADAFRNADNHYFTTDSGDFHGELEGPLGTAVNDPFATSAPANATGASVSFSTDTTERYILIKPGSTAVTSPNQTTSPVGIAAQGFGYDILRRYVSHDPGDGIDDFTYPDIWGRYLVGQNFRFIINLSYSIADPGSNFGVVANIYRRNVDRTYTYLYGAQATVGTAPLGNKQWTINVGTGDIRLAYGETIHVELWARGRGTAVVGQTVSFLIGQTDPSRLWCQTGYGLRSYVEKGEYDLAGTITPSGLVKRKPCKRGTGTITPSAAIVRRPRLLKAGSIVPAAIIIRRICKLYLGFIAPSGVTIKRPRKQGFAGLITPSGLIVRRARKSELSGTITPVGSYSRYPRRIFSGVITPSAILGRFIKKSSLSGGITPAATLTRRARMTYTGSTTPTSEVIRRVFLHFVGSITPSANVGLTLRGIFTGSIIPFGFATRRQFKLLEAEIGPTGDCPECPEPEGFQIVQRADVIAIDIDGVNQHSSHILEMVHNSNFAFHVLFTDYTGQAIDITDATVEISFRRKPYDPLPLFTVDTAGGDITILDQSEDETRGRVQVSIASSRTSDLTNQQHVLYFDTDITLDGGSTPSSPIKTQRFIVNPEVTS